MRVNLYYVQPTLIIRESDVAQLLDRLERIAKTHLGYPPARLQVWT